MFDHFFTLLLAVFPPFLVDLFLVAFLALLLGVAAFWGVAEADPAAAAGAAAGAAALLAGLLAFLAPAFFILLVPVFLVLLAAVFLAGALFAIKELVNSA